MSHSHTQEPSASNPSATEQLDALRRAAKLLQRGWIARDPGAKMRVSAHPLPGRDPDKHADFLHIIARENGFASWPALKQATEDMGLDRATALQRLKIALAQGQNDLVDRLLARFPDLAQGVFGLECALFDLDAVQQMLARDPDAATRAYGPRSAMAHLCFSPRLRATPERQDQMLAIAQALLDHGADVNDVSPFGDHKLPVLYGAIAADNMPLVAWLLDHGANPNDGESLYHATELGHHEGLRLLLAAGADPIGTNALLRAMDFDDLGAVALLLDHGARADDFNPAEIGGEAPTTCPALHHAARRGCDADLVRRLLSAGADPNRLWNGVRPYEFARLHGDAALAQAIDEAGGDTGIHPALVPLIDAVEGRKGAFIDPAQLPPACDTLLRDMVSIPEKLPQAQRLVAAGLPYDGPDRNDGLTPVQIAGWSGLPQMLDWLLRQNPDLSHVNAYGGTLLDTIVHGSENNPDRDRPGRDYLSCLDRVLHEGVALPRGLPDQVGRSDVGSFLADWAQAHPGQVV